MCVCVFERVRESLCVSNWQEEQNVCECECECVKEREKESERERKRERKRVRERVLMISEQVC